MSISNRFATARKKLGYNQSQFSKELGVSTSAITNYERGVNDLSAATIVKLHERFNISPTWLLTGQGSTFSNDDSKLVEEAALAVIEILSEKELDASPQKIAELIRHFYEEMRSGQLADKEVQTRRARLVVGE